jgi:hypothetical protein
MQEQHNRDFKEEVELPRAKRQKPNISEKLFDDSDKGKITLIKFVNSDDIRLVAHYDSKILDYFPSLYHEIEHNKTIKLKRDMFEVLPIINKIFIKNDFEIKLSSIIHEDVKLLDPLLIINTIKFIKKYTWLDDNKCLYNYIYTCLEYSQDSSYLSKLYAASIKYDTSEEKYIVKLFANIFKSICDENINTAIDKKLLMVSLDFSCISEKFIKNLPSAFAKYFMDKFLTHKGIFGKSFTSNR